jgi:citrate synthase
MSGNTQTIHDAPAGLEGVVVAATNIGDVNGTKGFYHYRGYNAVELAADLSYEQVWYLLHNGQLPNEAQLKGFRDQTASLRVLPDVVGGVLPLLRADRSVPLLSQLRSAISIAGAALGWTPWLGTSPVERADQALQAVSITPLLIAGLARGEDVSAGAPELGIVGDFLTRLGIDVTPEQTRALEQYLITTIDHGFNASTFAARVVTSTGADLGAALTAAIGALSGPLHGGAPSLALTMLEEIGTASRAESWVQQKLDSGERIMGFGHRVYRGTDPRADFLREVAVKLGSPRAQLALEVEEVILASLARHRPGRVLATNVEYWAAVVMESVGLSPDLFTPAFTMSRMVGWTAHIAEQMEANKLIRPSSRYVGPLGAP